MSQYLFLFTIGPVQSFIAQARKTQDLYTGSFLLSYLIDFAMNKLKSSLNEKCEFIFPDKNVKSKPNRFIATIESDDIKVAGNNLENYVRKEFQKIAKTALDSLNIKHKDEFKELFRKQIEMHLQVNWVAIPLKDDYAHSYEKLERNLGAIKNVRQFDQLNNGNGETGRKCSLCGERNVKVYQLNDKEIKNGGLKVRKDGLLSKLYMKKDDVIFFKPKNSEDRLKLAKGEGLCAVCFTKRFADKYFEKESYTKHFPSTAEIAAMDWLKKIPNEEKEEYKKNFENFDEQLFYEENLREEYLKKCVHSKDEKSLSNARKKLKDFCKTKDKNGNKMGKPPKYYALIMLDGDSMGKWLSGEFLEDKGKKELRNFHKKLSEELGTYAKDVENIIKEPKPKGKLVYAGGDDVMAFVNLENLFETLKDLRTNFPKFEKLGFKIANDRKSTASAGIVIAHYKTPLSEVLKWARKMEHEAKENGGRDAFAIAVLKHTGEIRKTVLKWQYGTSSIIEILKKVVEALKEDYSNTFIKNLDNEFRLLMDKKGKYDERGILKTEIKRLVNRSCIIKKRKNETKKRFEARKKLSINNLTEGLFMLCTNSKSLNNFLSALDIADFMEREA